MTAGAVIGRSVLLVLALLSTACSTSVSTGSPVPVQAAPGAFALGCVGIDQAECEGVAAHVATALPAERGAPFAIVIELYDCPHEIPCARSLAARGGKATAEFVGGAEPIVLGLKGPPATPATNPIRVLWSGLIAPTSPRIAGGGPVPYEIGHCGLTWQVDFDGAFWLLVGQVESGAAVLINGESGTIRLVDPNHAVYTSPTGFTAQLIRFPGPKHVWLCD